MITLNDELRPSVFAPNISYPPYDIQVFKDPESKALWATDIPIPDEEEDSISYEIDEAGSAVLAPTFLGCCPRTEDNEIWNIQCRGSFPESFVLYSISETEGITTLVKTLYLPV